MQEDFWMLEEEGRKRSSGFGEIPFNDVSFLERLSRRVRDLAKRKSELEEFSEAISQAATALSIPAEMCMHEGTTREDCTVPQYVIEEMRRVDEASRKLFGRPCTWLLGRRSREYNLSLALNDLTACYHRVLEHAFPAEEEADVIVIR